MTTTVAEIAKKAFDGVASKIIDAILAATVDRKVDGAYDYDTGTHAEADAPDFLRRADA